MLEQTQAKLNELEERAEDFHSRLVSMLGAIGAIPEAAAWATREFADECRRTAKDPKDLTIEQVLSVWESRRERIGIGR